jgi:hypothetical protein
MQSQPGKPSQASLLLLQAARDADVAAIRHHLAAGADVMAYDEDYQCPLHHALYKFGGGSSETQASMAVEAFETLIAEGCDPNVLDDDCNTVWGRFLGRERTSRNHVFRLVKSLIASGAQVNISDSNGWTPLHWAAQYGHIEIIKLLIANGAHTEAKDDEGQTPIALAQSESAKAMLQEVAVQKMKQDAVEANVVNLLADATVEKELAEKREAEMRRCQITQEEHEFVCRCYEVLRSLAAKESISGFKPHSMKEMTFSKLEVQFVLESTYRCVVKNLSAIDLFECEAQKTSLIRCIAALQNRLSS